jgi:hypothetical protein
MKLLKQFLLVSLVMTISCKQKTDQAKPFKVFPDLSEVLVNTNAGASVFCKKNNCEIINKPSKLDPTMIDVLIANLVASNSSKYLIQYSDEPSGDPHFLFYRIEKDTLIGIGRIPSDNIYIPGNGFLYSSCRADRMFETREKYIISRDTLSEVKQPFYFVGLESEALQELNLYSDTELTKVVATIPKGSPVFIVANQKDYYLLKTPFGLLGWVQVSDKEYGETKLKGIAYAGD